MFSQIKYESFEPKSQQNLTNHATIYSSRISIPVQSDLQSIYSTLLHPVHIDRQKIHEQFSRNRIIYDPSSDYQPFHFSLEKMVPCFGYYQAHVKIAHFSLSISLLKYAASNNIEGKNIVEGSYGRIYFSSVFGQQLCFKSFPYKEISEFQRMFAMAIKQWTILKICSIMKCAAYLTNYLGFDIVVYQDSIVFATENGKNISSLDQMEVRQLQVELRLMHEFKIVHRDIKPDNLIYSEQCKKPVFIDFGLSDIVNQEIGFKTLTFFKGTPRFCPKETIQIMMEKQAYIDLYYNDAFALSLVVKEIRQNQEMTFDSEDQECLFDSLIIKESSNNKQPSDLGLFPFQFYYLNSNLLKSKQVLLQYLSICSNNVKKILSFIKAVSKYVFSPQIFNEELYQFHQLSQYQDILQENKVNCERNFFIYIDNQSRLEEQIIMDQHIQLNLFQLFRNSNKLNYHHYFNTIMNLCTLQANLTNHYIAISFQCIRFDVKNLQFFEKILAARKMNTMLSLHSYNNHQAETGKADCPTNDLVVIKEYMINIFRYCMASKPNKWIQKNLFQINQQMMMLDIDYSLFIDEIFHYINQHDSYFNEVQMIFEFVRIQQSMSMIITKNFDNLLIIQEKLEKYITEYKKRFEKIAETSKDPQIKAIQQMLLYLEQQKICGFQTSMIQNKEKLSLIKNPRIKRHLFYHLIIKTIRNGFSLNNTQQFFKSIQSVKRSIQVQNLDLLSKLRINMKLMGFTSSYSALKSYIKNAGQIINCPQVFKRLDLAIGTSTADSVTSFVSKTQLLIQRYPFICRIDKTADYQIIQLIQQKKLYNTQIEAQILGPLLELFAIYEQYRSAKVSPRREQFQHYYLIYFRVIIQFHFYKLNPSADHLFIKTLEQTQREYAECANQDFSIHKIELAFKICLYQYYVLLQNKKYQQCMINLAKAFNICDILKIDSLKLQLLKLLNQTSWKWANEEQVIITAEKLYHFCKSTQCLDFYLLPRNSHFAIKNLFVFARRNNDYFYQLLISFTRFFCSHPIQSYFASFLKVLDSFIKIDPTDSHKIHYSKFQISSASLKANPYLLVFYIYSLYNEDKASQLKMLTLFASNCHNLSQFARKQLLQKYYRVYITYLRQQKIQHRLFVYRTAKNYIGTTEQSKQINCFLKAFVKKKQRSQKYLNCMSNKLKKTLRQN